MQLLHFPRAAREQPGHCIPGWLPSIMTSLALRVDTAPSLDPLASSSTDKWYYAVCMLINLKSSMLGEILL